jgi:DNA ligase-1
VLDGEILAFRGDRPLPFSALQQRIGRQKQVARTARDIPVVFMAYDILERNGVDIRSEPLSARRAALEEAVTTARLATREPGSALLQAADRGAADVARDGTRKRPRAAAEPLLPFEDQEPGFAGESVTAAPDVIRISPLVSIESWDELSRLRDTSRELGVEGLMLKRRDSPYGVGRKRGDWWKWKIDPFSIDAVLIYAQPGSGKRASLLTDYTFGLWDNGELVPVAKAYSGLTNDEIAEMDRWIRRHTVQRFGPVRHVEPVHVFELGFEAIAKSSRHRSGVAVRFPRMLRWRKDKPATEADTLDALRAMITEQ